jgi:hypothetical protein
MLNALTKLSQGEESKPPLAANEENIKLAMSLTEATKRSKPAEQEHSADDDTYSKATDATDPFVVAEVEKMKNEEEDEKKTANDMPAKIEPGRDSMDVDDLAKVSPNPSKGKKKKHDAAAQQQEETVSEAASDTDTVSGGGEVLSGENNNNNNQMKSAVKTSFETKLNRSAIKYNRLPVSPEFARSLELLKNKGVEWSVRDHQDWSWPITFHQEGGFEMIKGWRPIIEDLELDVGSVLMMFRPDPDQNSIEVRKVDQGLKKEATGQKIGDVTLGEIISDETISSTSGDISAVRHIEYRGKKHTAFLKKVAIGAVRSYGSNPPRLELHHKAGSVLLFLKQKMEAGNFHVDCELKYNDKGDHHMVKVTIRNYIVLRWSNPSYKRFYNLQEGDTITFNKVCFGLIDVQTEPGSSDIVHKRRAKPGEGGPRQTKTNKRQKTGGSPSKENNSDKKDVLRDTTTTKITKLAKDMIEGGKLFGGKKGSRTTTISRKVDGSSCLPVRALQYEYLSNRAGATASALADPASSHSALGEYESIEALLKDQGLHKYASLFRKEAVTLKTLRTGLVTEEHLKELGLPIGPRLEILRLLKDN